MRSTLKYYHWALPVNIAKKLLLTVLFLITVLSCVAQQNKGNWEDESLRDSIKTIRYCSYSADSIKDLLSRSFNVKNYYLDSFDQNKNIRCTYEIKNTAIRMVSQVEYTLDSKGNITEQCQYFDNKTASECTSILYDLKFNIIQKTFFSRHNNTKHITVYINKPNGIIIKLDSINQKVYKTVFKYNGNKKIEEKSYAPNDIINTIKYAYDERGNLISETWVDSKLTYLYVYNEYNDIITIMTVNSLGKKISEFTTEYIYDSRGNWIRRIEDERSKFGGIEPSYKLTIREIEYY